MVNTAELALELFNKAHGLDKKPSDLKSFYQMDEWLKELNPDSPKMASMKFWNNSDVLLKSPPVRGAIETLNFLKRNGIRPYFITSRPATAQEETFEWFKIWLPWVERDQIMIRNETEPGSVYKPRMIKELEVGIHFEDSIDHVQVIRATSFATTIVLINQPWNKMAINDAYVIRHSHPRSDCNLYYSYLALVNSLTNRG